MVAEYMKGLCRTCVDRSDDYIRIYDEVVPDNIPFYCIINDLCQLGIQPKDGFPEYICKDCFAKISELMLFKRKCHDAKNSFISMGESMTEELAKDHGPQEEVDSAANITKREVDMATKIIKEQMDSGCAVETEAVFKDIIAMPIDLVYEEVVMGDDPIGLIRKTVDKKNPNRRQMKKIGHRRKREGRKRDAAHEETVLEYNEVAPEEIPRTLTVAQSYYAYLLKNGKSDEVSNQRCLVDDTCGDKSTMKETPTGVNGSRTHSNVVEGQQVQPDASDPIQIDSSSLNSYQVEGVVKASEEISGGRNDKEVNSDAKEIGFGDPLRDAFHVEPTIAKLNDQLFDPTTSGGDLGTPVHCDLKPSNESFVSRLESEEGVDIEVALKQRKRGERIISTMKLRSKKVVGKQMSTADGSSGGETTFPDIPTISDDSESSLSPVMRTEMKCLPPKKRPFGYLRDCSDVPSNGDPLRESQLSNEGPFGEEQPKGNKTPRRLIRCDYCTKTCYKTSVMEDHLKSVHMKKIREVYGCSICGSEFVNEEGLTCHKKFHDRRVAECPDLPSAIKIPRSERAPTYTCDKCQSTVKGRMGLLIHDVEVHLNEPVYSCVHCKGKFLKEERRDLHEKHCAYRRVPCSMCEKQVMAWLFQQHLCIHSGEKRYLCSICGRGYMGGGDLSRHMRETHFGQPPKKKCLCAYCPKAYFTPNKLRMHELTHSAEKPFKCEECGKGFAYAYSLRKHQENRESSCLPVIQMASKPYACLVCRKGWDTKAKLKKHIEWVHQMKRPELAFACDLCPKRFYWRNLLESHKVMHTREKRFSCTHCDFRCMYRCNLKSHIRRVHPNVSVS